MVGKMLTLECSVCETETQLTVERSDESRRFTEWCVECDKMRIHLRLP